MANEIDPKDALQNLVNVYEAQRGLRPAEVRLCDQSIVVLARIVAPEQFEQPALGSIDIEAHANGHGEIEDAHVDVAVD